MSHEDLRTLFADLAGEVTEAQLVGPALNRTKQVRRRRRMVATGCVALVLVLGIGVALRPGAAAPVPPPTSPTAPAPSVTTSPERTRVDHLPARLARRAGTPYPASLQPPAAPPLAQAPISRATVLVARFNPESADPAWVIYAYGEGSMNQGSGNGEFHWARVAVDLVPVRDAGGNEALPVDRGSLGPMGARAAFAQPDAVVVVDLSTGAVSRIPLPGLNEHVTWLTTGFHVLVSSATRTWLVDIRTRQAVPVAAMGWAVTPLVGEGSGITTLTDPGPNGELPVIVHYDDAGLAERGRTSMARPVGADYRISYLDQRGWRYGHQIAVAAGGQIGSGPGDFVVVTDDRSGSITHVLDLGAGRDKGCCAVLGWNDAGTVLVYTEQEGLLEWSLVTGEVAKLSDPGLGVQSIAPMGCDWTLNVGDQTYSCIT